MPKKQPKRALEYLNNEDERQSGAVHNIFLCAVGFPVGFVKIALLTSSHFEEKAMEKR